MLLVCGYLFSCTVPVYSQKCGCGGRTENGDIKWGTRKAGYIGLCPEGIGWWRGGTERGHSQPFQVGLRTHSQECRSLSTSSFSTFVSPHHALENCNFVSILVSGNVKVNQLSNLTFAPPPSQQHPAIIIDSIIKAVTIVIKCAIDYQHPCHQHISDLCAGNPQSVALAQMLRNASQRTQLARLGCQRQKAQPSPKLWPGMPVSSTGACVGMTGFRSSCTRKFKQSLGIEIPLS